MSEQTLFVLLLYLTGAMLGLLFKGRLSIFYICATSFLWGALIYVVGLIAILSLSAPYTKTTITAFGVSILGLLLGLNLTRGTWRLNRREWLTLSSLTVVFVSLTILFDRFNFSTGSADSIFILMMAKVIATGDLNAWVGGSPKGFGILIPAIHSSAGFLSIDYLPALQPTIALALLLTFLYFCYRLTAEYIDSFKRKVFLAILTALVLFSTPIVFHNIFYIHTNLVASVFFLTAVCSFWLGIREDSDPLLFFGIMSLLGFSLCRTETPLFALTLLAVLFGQNQLSYRKRIYLGIPYALAMITWLWLISRMDANTYSDIISVEIIYLYIVVFIVFIGAVSFSNMRWVKNYVLPYLHSWLVVILALTLCTMYVLKPSEMILSLQNLSFNIVREGGWGITGLFVLTYLVFSPSRPPLRNERLFANTISAFFLLTLVLGYLRTPYRVGWWDSANRMLVHVVPIALVYILLKFCQGPFWPAPIKQAATDDL